MAFAAQMVGFSIIAGDYGNVSASRAQRKADIKVQVTLADKKKVESENIKGVVPAAAAAPAPATKN